MLEAKLSDRFYAFFSKYFRQSNLYKATLSTQVLKFYANVFGKLCSSFHDSLSRMRSSV